MKVGGGNRKIQRESGRELEIKHGRKEKNKNKQDEKPARGARGMGNARRGRRKETEGGNENEICGKRDSVETRKTKRQALMKRRRWSAQGWCQNRLS